MITRRRGRNNALLPSLEVSVVDAELTDSPSPTDGFPADATNASGLELDDLFDLEDLKWTLESGISSPFSDMELSDFGGFGAKEEDSREVSRGPSLEMTASNFKLGNRQHKSRHMINKNAIAARINRLKKKEYVNSLEKKVSVMATENNSLKQENSQLTKRVEELEDETRYLRAVLANQSMLAQLLSRLSGVNGMKLSSSLFQGHDTNDHDYALPRKRVKVKERDTSGGVCLHVDKDHVSVEFCTKCAESASAALKM